MVCQGLPVPTVCTSMAVTITHVLLWGRRATNHIENALMGSPCGVHLVTVRNIKNVHHAMTTRIP